ncbi:MAG: DNA polymerase III subunit delta [Deltaproteobacteria bacterium]|nr:DNA polymerase III subunit delta [Deltaproteobacteria bacterium]
MERRGDDAGQVASLDMVLAELRQGKQAPCYLLCGDEEFRLRDALDKITAALIPDPVDRELNLSVTDGENEDPDALCESLITAPLLPGPKVVLVRNTRLFQSKNVLAPLIGRIRERLGQEPSRAAADFMQFLAITGLQLDDLRDGGWRRIDDDSWRRIVPEGGDDRESWLPKAVELCAGRESAPAREKHEDSERLERVLTGGMPEGNCLILTAEAVDRRKRLFKTVTAIGRVLVFARVKGEARQQQIVMEMAAGLLERAGKRLSSAAWAALGQKTGFSLRESLGAIEKLVTYAGEKPVIEAQDVENLIGRTKEGNVFDLTGALAGRNLKAALASMQALLERGDPPLMIFSMIVREIRLLFQAKLLIASGSLAGFSAEMEYGRFQKTVHPALKKLAGDGEGSLAIASQHPFVVYQALKNAGRFGREELAGYLELLLQTDLALKTTGRDPRLLLERVMIAVCGRR